mmetsp:Transcript_50088/g.134055  ORF Transcript_50088/g.134055 Transcript_50088/m.134055 type:complete len:89 (+) Transcript_50088:322-588(+)
MQTHKGDLEEIWAQVLPSVSSRPKSTEARAQNHQYCRKARLPNKRSRNARKIRYSFKKGIGNKLTQASLIVGEGGESLLQQKSEGLQT